MKKLTGSRFRVAQAVAMLALAFAIVGCESVTSEKIDSYLLENRQSRPGQA